MSIEIEDELERLYYEGLSEQTETNIVNKNSLPKVVERYVKSATDVSKYNEVPATISFFVLLGQLCKDMVAIPSGRRIDDTRIQFLWMQTSGTGKTTLYDFFGPVANLSFKMINEKHGTEFDIFDVKDTTDAALIGSFKEEDVMVEDEDGRTSREKVLVPIKGALEGDGLAAYDEFEYSGVFKQSQHKENVIMYMNTFMNSLHGENWKISKRLKDGEVLECLCRRSLFGTTYIPKQLTNIIAEKGVMQRCLIYIAEIPQEVQDELREAILLEVGTIKERNMPINNFASNFLIIYDTLHEHFVANGENALETIRFGSAFNDALLNESYKMRNFVSDSRTEVFEIAGNFITRMNAMMVRLSVLCCIAEAPSITDTSKRFIVTERHVRQASSMIRQCYKSLVSWLDTALKVKAQSLADKKEINSFIEVYDSLSANDEWVNKTVLMEAVRKKTKKGQATIYRWYNDILENTFDEKKIGRKTYLRKK